MTQTQRLTLEQAYELALKALRSNGFSAEHADARFVPSAWLRAFAIGGQSFRRCPSDAD